MTVFKCKMCGAPLEVGGETTATCEYCGTAQTLPKLDDEKIANLYDRANHFRRNNEYDKAMGMYEQILDANTKDAEAYWSLVLCKYGIEYVEDPTTHKRVPTVNRTQFTSVFDDDNYKKALEYADAVQRKLYEEEAKTINEIQKGILAISQKEEPFDVFICYKETDNAGRRTQDSVLAQELYYELTKEGFKVFFSRITLEDKLGTAYEPYIFAALNSAKVMVVLGTRTEHFNAVWVKNEWSRYLGLIKGGAKKTLVPAYKDMDPYDLPEEFSHLQAQDMNKLGFMQDLVRGTKKIIGNDEIRQQTATSEKVVERVVEKTAGTNTDTLLRRVFMFLEDGEWERANEYCEKVLDIDPENAYAYFGKILARGRVHRREELADKTNLIFTKGTEYEKIKKFGDTALISEIDGYIKIIEERRKNENENEKLRQLERKYDSGKYNIEMAKKGEQNSKRIRSYQLAIEQFDAILNYKDAKMLAEQCRQGIVEIQKDEIYCKAEEEFKQNNYIKAIELYEQIKHWKDTETKIESCHKAIADLEAKAEIERIEKERQEAIAKQKAAESAERNKKLFRIGVPIVTVVALIIIVMMTVVIPNGKYDDAVALMDAGRYEEAITVFEELDGHKDSTVLIDDCKDAIQERDSQNAVALMEQGNYADALVLLETVGEYRASTDKIIECKYMVGKEALAENNLKDGLSYLMQVASYKDARELVSKWGNKVTATNRNHSAVLKADGTVVASGSNKYGQCNVSEWSDIVAISAGLDFTIGLKADGTVVATGENSEGQCNVENWNNIIAVSAGEMHTVGLKADGTVVTTGNNKSGQCDVSGWKNIVDISAGSSHTVGLKADGTAVAVGADLYYDDGDILEWTDIIDISAGGCHTVGLKSDGTVVAEGISYNGVCTVKDWTDIVAIATGDDHTVGLKADGTVVATGENDYNQCTVMAAEDILIMAVGSDSNIVVNSDGVIEFVGGYGDDAQLNIEEVNLFEQ